MRLRNFVRINPSKSEVARLSNTTEVTFAPMEAIADGLGGLDTSLTKTIEEVGHGSYSYFAEGDILLAKVTPCFENGKKARAQGLKNGIGFATSEVHVIRPTTGKIDPAFLTYVLSSEDFRAAGMASMTGAGGLRRISEGAILDYRVSITDLSAQKAIADFLDRETSRIDQLIEKKERMIGKIDKRATSLTWTLVTGRDLLEFPFTDSGFEWIGTIPSHWRAVRIKTVARLESGHTPSRSVDEYWTNSTIPWVSLADSTQLRRVDVITETTHMISEAGLAGSSARILPKGTVAFTRDATVGLAAILGRDMAVSQHLVGWVCGSELEPHYLLHVIYAMQHELNRLTWGATIKTIGMPDLRKLSCPLPPLEEQRQIVQRLATGLESSKQLRANLTESIAGLRERRSALITAAVTGQIDVATWGKQGETDRRLEAIERDLEAEREEAAV